MNLQRTIIAASLLMACTFTHAAGLTGLWVSDTGDYFMLSRDSATTYGVQVGAEKLDLKGIWVGGMLANRVDYFSLDRSKRLAATLRDGKLAGTLTENGVATDFSATLKQPWMGGSLDGIWKKEGTEGYLVVFNADDGSSEGTSFVSDIDLSTGTPAHRVWSGKQSGNTFADTDSPGGLRLTLPTEPDGKLSGAYVDQDPEVLRRLSLPDAGMPGYPQETPVISPIKLVAPSDGTTRATAGTGSTATATTTTSTATTSSSTFTATKVSKTTDADAQSASRSTTPDETKKGCEGLFGKVQKDLSDQFKTEMASTANGKTAQTPGKIVSTYQVGTTSVFDGGTVPLYQIVIASDTRYNMEPFILKQAVAQNGFVECKLTNETFSTTDYIGFDKDAAQTSCTQLYSQASDFHLTYAAFSTRGLQPVSLGFGADYTVTLSSTYTPTYTVNPNLIRVGIALDTDGNFPDPSTNGVQEKPTETVLIERCKAELVKPDLYFNALSILTTTVNTAPATYPTWTSNKPTGTAEQLFCMNPSFINPVIYPTYTEPTGILAVDLGSASAVLRVKMDPSNKTLVNFTGDSGSVDVMVPRHGYYEPSGFNSSSFVVTGNNKCGYDSLAAEWDWSAASKACETLPSSITAQLGEQAYKAMKKTSSTDNLNSMERMADGMGTNLAATLGALKVGGFEPKTTVKDKNFISTVNVSAVYGYDSMKVGGTSAANANVVHYSLVVPYCPNL